MATAESIVSRVAAEIGAKGVDHDADIAKISLVGAGMKTSPGIAAKMFRTLADEGVNIEMISTSRSASAWSPRAPISSGPPARCTPRSGSTRGQAYCGAAARAQVDRAHCTTHEPTPR